MGKIYVKGDLQSIRLWSNDDLDEYMMDICKKFMSTKILIIELKKEIEELKNKNSDLINKYL